MDAEQKATIIEELDQTLEVYTPQGGNFIDSQHVIQHDIIDGDILVELTDGTQFAIKVEAL